MTNLLIRPLLAGLLLAGILAPAFSEDLQVVKASKVYGNVFGYKAGDAFYVGAKDAAAVYGGGLYWRPVQGSVQLSLRGKRFAFSADSDEVNEDGVPFKMPRPMIVRASQSLIPVEFFSSPAFSEASGFDTRFDPRTKLLTVDPRANAGPIRWFTHLDHTRLVLDLKGDLSWKASRRGRGGLDVSLPMAVVVPAKVEINDGAVEGADLEQEARLARLSVRLQEGAKDWKVQLLDAPRRLVIDVARKAPLRELPSQAKGPPQAPGPSAPASPEQAALAAQASQHEAPAAAEPPQAADAEPAAPAVPPPPPAKPRNARRRIVIDAGHGGKDSGALGRGVREKDINLRAARELAKALKDKGKFDVLLTRDKDVFIPLGDRSKIANEFNADLFISLHCNAHRSRAETGFEVYFQSERASDPEAERLAEFENSVLSMENKVEDEAANLLYALARTEFINDSAQLSGFMTKSLARRVDLANRGVKQAAFYVLRGANEPAVLVEMGFVSNSKDAGKLDSLSYRRKIIEGLYEGVMEYARAKTWVAGEGR